MSPRKAPTKRSRERPGGASAEAEPANVSSPTPAGYSQERVEAAAATLTELDAEAPPAAPTNGDELSPAAPAVEPLDAAAYARAREYVIEAGDLAASFVHELWKPDEREVERIARPLARVLQKYGLELEGLSCEWALALSLALYAVPRMLMVQSMHKAAREKSTTPARDLRPASFPLDQH